MRSAPLLAAAAALACAVGVVRGQAPSPTSTPPASRAVGSGRFSALSNALALYSPRESSWAENRADHAVESRVFALMRAEVRLWDLQEALGPQDRSAYEDAAEIARIIHAQVLAGATEALPLLQETPNKPFAQLLVRQLEAYPYEGQEEGFETLLPTLHKLADPAAGSSPVRESTVRRHRRRPVRPSPTPAPTPPTPAPSPAIRT